jgi:ABC-type Fe3+/spermidine/putrescine transport system ATPase subunit
MINDDLESLKNKSFVCLGGGGCGKTTTLVALNSGEDTLVLCFTNKACDNIRQRGIENVFTFSSYFHEDGMK